MAPKLFQPDKYNTINQFTCVNTNYSILLYCGIQGSNYGSKLNKNGVLEKWYHCTIWDHNKIKKRVPKKLKTLVNWLQILTLFNLNWNNFLVNNKSQTVRQFFVEELAMLFFMTNRKNFSYKTLKQWLRPVVVRFLKKNYRQILPSPKILRKSINGPFSFKRVFGKFLSSLNKDDTENGL